jgi:hypothetical protein
VQKRPITRSRRDLTWPKLVVSPADRAVANTDSRARKARVHGDPQRIPIWYRVR